MQFLPSLIEVRARRELEEGFAREFGQGRVLAADGSVYSAEFVVSFVELPLSITQLNDDIVEHHRFTLLNFL
jgi:hypothetical protein